MRDQPKTLSDICARIRTIDESMMRDLDFMAVFLKYLPRDIEAAAERERQDAMKTALLAKCKVCEKVGPASSPGSAAEMREALIYVRDLMRSVKDGDRVSSLAFLGVVEHALAAPARNCDRFATAAEAALAFNADTKTKCGEEISPRLLAWLFDKAKGGDHA